VNRAVSDAVGLAALATVALVVVVVWVPVERPLAVDAYLLFLGALALLALTRLTRSAAPPAGSELELREEERALEQLPELARLEREIVLASANAFDFHVRLRRRLEEIARHRLESRHGVRLDAEPERARSLLGNEAWEIVRPGRELPQDRHAQGIGRDQLRSLVDALARL
jgi:hypothetical protein